MTDLHAGALSGLPAIAPLPPLPAAPSAPGHEARTGLALMSASVTAVPFGQACAAHAVAGLSAPGVVALRQVVTAAVLLPVARPRLHRLTRAQWWPALALGAVFVVMNVCLLSAIDRIGVALAITLEFLGPLATALLASRSRRDLLLALAAGVGVYVLVLPGPSSDLLGVGLALGAAAGWAAYIQVNRVLGARLPGLEGTAVASLVATVLMSPVLVWLVATGRLHGTPLLWALAAGVLSSVVPYACDLMALRRVPRRVYGVFMSLNLVTAALAGLLLLGERLAPHELVGIAMVVAVNAACSLAAARPRGVPVLDAAPAR